VKINEILTEAFSSKWETLEALDAALSGCTPYFQTVDRDSALTDMALYRGDRRFNWEQSYDPFRIVEVSQSRKPVNTRKEVHAIIDNWCFEQFGIRFRSASLFCSNNEFTAATYGSVGIVVPVGEFNYLWSPKIDDLFISVARGDAHDRIVAGEEPLNQIIISILEQAEYQFNTGLPAAIDCGNEIMVACKTAVIVNPIWT